MTYNSMHFLRKAMFYEEKLIGSLKEMAEAIETSWEFQDVEKEQILEKLRMLENDSLHHEEILDYWIEQINSGVPI